MQEGASRDVVITGMGAVCALGEDCDALWRALDERRTGIAPIERFPTTGFSVALGALVPSWSSPRPGAIDDTAELCGAFAADAAREALASAGLTAQCIATRRIALVFGTGVADVRPVVHRIGEGLADALGLSGPRITVSTACSSSTAAIGFARDLLALGAADVVVAGGSDVVTPEVFAGFYALGVLSPRPCAPFSVPAGTTLGEGAGFLVLEREEDAAARGAPAIATLSGYALSADGWHETSPEPKGSGIERAIHGALGDAGLHADAIGYVNVHGSGTEANDMSEWLGLSRALGSRAGDVPVSSTKGALGHAQGAAGAIEVIATLLASRHGRILPTMHMTTPRTHAPTDAVGEAAPRHARWDHALKLNSAFGGSNVGLVLSRSGGRRQSARRGSVFLVGDGAVGPGGLGAEAFVGRVPGSTSTVPPFQLESVVAGIESRGLDPASRFLTAAAALALADGGVAVHGALRERTGLLVGQLRGSPASLLAFQRSIDARGLAHLSPTAFARIVLNAATGFCSKLLALRGPLSVITTGPGSALTAVLLAVELLSTRDDVDLMLAGGCDEHHPAEASALSLGDEGAACLLLANQRGLSAASSRPVRVAGWGIAGPGAIADAVARAGGASPRVAPRTFRAEDAAGGGEPGGAVALAAAARAIRRGDIGHALVTSHAGNSASTAILLSGDAA